MTTLTIAHPDTTIHEATAAAIIRVLEANDVEPEITIGPKNTLRDMLSSGEVDLYVSAWLPEDAAFLASGVTSLGVLFNPSVSCCLSQEHNATLTSLSSLAQVSSELSRDVVVPESLLHHAEAMFSAYALKDAGFTLRALPDEEALATFSAALAKEQLVLTVLAQPCYLFHQGGFRILQDPKEALGQEMTAHILLRPGLADEMDRDLYDELDELMLSTKVISAMDYAMRAEGLSADDAAESWQRGKLLPR